MKIYDILSKCLHISGYLITSETVSYSIKFSPSLSLYSLSRLLVIHLYMLQTLHVTKSQYKLYSFYKPLYCNTGPKFESIPNDMSLFLIFITSNKPLYHYLKMIFTIIKAKQC